MAEAEPTLNSVIRTVEELEIDGRVMDLSGGYVARATLVQLHALRARLKAREKALATAIVQAEADFVRAMTADPLNAIHHEAEYDSHDAKIQVAEMRAILGEPEKGKENR